VCVCYIARADITQYFLMLRPAARRTEAASEIFPLTGTWGGRDAHHSTRKKSYHHFNNSEAVKLS